MAQKAKVVSRSKTVRATESRVRRLMALVLLYPELTEDAREVLRTLIKTESQIPLPHGAHMIDGVVITFTDATAYKNLEAELRKSRD